MTNEVLNPAQRAEEARDLTKQLGNLGLDSDEQQFFTLKETSPVRRKTRLWSMEDGNSYEFFNFRVRALLDQTMPDGRPRWTSYQERAPVITVSEYPCFLAPESEIRAELDSLGIVVRCRSKHPSKFSMEQVASKKHPQSWKAWQAHLKEKQDRADRDRQDQQVAAMMQLAAQRTTPNTELPYDANGVSLAGKTCANCGGHIEGSDSFAVARHNKTCPGKDGG